MFDNPFDSFHNAVAEAKEEREQLDRLLTISTPRERLLVVLISITIVAFAIWLFFGQITHSLAVNGTLTFPEGATQTTNETTQLEVLVQSRWMTKENASQITVHLPATIEISVSDRNSAVISGKVASIDAVHVAGESESLQTPIALSLYKIGLALNAEIDLSVLRDRNCRVVFLVGTRSPISLFGMRRS